MLSVNANPFFIDGNNLLTQPASLIRDEAIWTDVRHQVPGSDTLNIFPSLEFDLTGVSGMDIGFDIAVASPSQDLSSGQFWSPQTGTISTFYMNFEVLDANFNWARGGLLFYESDADFGLTWVAAEAAGTFNSLNSPRTAYEGRFRLSHEWLVDLIADYNPSDSSRAPISYFKLELNALPGNTQVAIDHFVVGDSPVPNDPLFEPLVYRPHAPVGRNTPIYLSKTDELDGVDPADILKWEDAINEIARVSLELAKHGSDFGGGESGTIDVTLLPGSPMHDASTIAVESKSQDLTPATLLTSFVIQNELPPGTLANMSAAFSDENRDDLASWMNAMTPEQRASLESSFSQYDTTPGAGLASFFSGLPIEMDNQVLDDLATVIDKQIAQIGEGVQNVTLGVMNDLNRNEAIVGGAKAIQFLDGDGNAVSGAFAVASSSDLTAGPLITEGSFQQIWGDFIESEYDRGVFATALSDEQRYALYRALAEMRNPYPSEGGPLGANSLLHEIYNVAAIGVMEEHGVFTSLEAPTLEYLQEVPLDSQAFLDAYIELLEPETQNIVVGNLIEEHAAMNGLVVRVRQSDGGSVGTQSMESMRLLSLPLGEGEMREPLIYQNYSLDEYLRLMAAEGLDPFIGDTGGYFEVLYDEDGLLTGSLRFHSWLIADEGGSYFTTVMAIPEPTTLGLLMTAALAMLGRPGRRTAA